jgi:hypothetical protein
MTKEESLLINFLRLDEKEQEEIISHARRLFIVREDTYAVQKVNRDGKQNYIRIDQPLTDEVLLKHFRGENTVGTYQLDTEAMVKWGCLDLDGEHVTEAKEKTRRLWHRLVNLGLKSDQILLEESGSENSYHIWIFFEEATSAKKAKAFLEWVARPIDPKIEVFPKQEKVGEEGYGNLVKIPLGFHKAAKRWSNCFLQTGEGKGVTGFEALRHLKTCELPKVPKLKTLGLRPCFKRVIDGRWVLKGPEGDVFRLALAAEMLTNSFSDEEMHSVFALQPNYNYERTQEKLAYSKANGYHTWKCESITAQCSALLAGMCEGCTRTSEGLDVKEDITAREGKGDNMKAPKKKGKKEKELTLADVLALPDYENSGEIENIIVLKKRLGGLEQDFYISAKLVNGELEHELTHYRAIPPQTAPSLHFDELEYKELQDLYTELHTSIMDYVAFTKDSIYPDLIALGCIASYFREIFYTYAYYDYISSEPEAGKTTAMKVQTFLSYYGNIASSVTEALLFREIDGSHCFYGLDNIERLFASPKDYASIIDWLLSSYSRDIPCKRLEKTEEGYEVRHFDGYGPKAFTHIKDFPFALRALRSRCIQIVMQNAKPANFYPSAEKFTETRDKLYKARLYEFETVKECYKKLININILSGRTGDLYLPLLSIAKLVDKKLFQRVLNYATTEEVERKELDSWNMMLIKVLLDNELLGSRSTNEIRGVYEEALILEGLLKDSTLATRTVTTRLKKLGFQRAEKRTENKTWYLIDREKLLLKAYEYNIINEDEVQKSINTHTPPKPNLPNLLNFSEDRTKDNEGSTEHSEEDKPSTEGIGNKVSEDGDELAKLTELAKRGVCESTKNVCDKCGGDGATELYKNSYYHPSCLAEIQHEEAKTTTRKTRSGISKGLDIEYVDLNKCNFTEAVK